MFQRTISSGKSRLSRQFLAVLLGIMVATFTFVYLYSVPLIKQKVFEIERNSSRLALNNVSEIANRMYTGVEEYRQQAMAHHHNQLEMAVTMAETFLRSYFREALKNGTPIEQARQTAFSYLRDFTYGNNDYIFVADYHAKMLSHPDRRYHGKLAENKTDINGLEVVANLVALARDKGQASYRYKWARLDGAEAQDKISYVRDFPEWGFVIGSGVYLDDVEAEVQHRRELALQELRLALQEIKVAKTGYMFVFDSSRHMLIHPNDNLDNTHFSNLLNPLTGQPIANDLIQVADTGKELHYRWDKPGDPGHYGYEKLSLVRYMPGFDWYICSSVYLDELQSSSDQLSSRILVLAGITMTISLLIAAAFIGRITQPLEQLAETALKVRSGDLSATSGIRRDDEVGILASSFDAMVQRLKTSIDSLDSKVKQRTEELLETNAKVQRMSAVGQLAGGLAHDFNNLLSIIMGNLILAKEQCKDEKGLDDLLSPALRAAGRGADITHRLLTFARRQPLRPEAVEVDRLVGETIELLHSSLGAQINIEFTPATHQAVCCVDPGHLENALVNLALNARDAMSQSGTLTISTSRLSVRRPTEYDESVKPGDYILINVSDSGCGFTSDAARLAFEPFFSTKGGRTNSGLGLSMVYGFVKQSNGYIRIESAPGQGASIQILLPLSAAAARRPESNASATAEFGGKLFLLVEDDEDVRAIVREQLVSFGINVVEAEDSDEAIDLIQTMQALDGLLSDIVMPGERDGRQLAEAMRQCHPESTVLLMSGYAFDTEQDQQNRPGIPLLHKPFDRDTLGQTLQKATGVGSKS